VILDYRSKRRQSTDDDQPSHPPAPVSEKRAWIEMVFWLLGFLAIALVMSRGKI
jgi:hypothetical protein